LLFSNNNSIAWNRDKRFCKIEPRDRLSHLEKIFEIFEKQERCGIDRAVASSDDLRNRQLGNRIMRATETSKRKKEKKREW
jgi:hypothetical protein